MFNKKLKLKIDRGSVCMGDDVFPHIEDFHIETSKNLADIVEEIYKIGFLPSISGGVATWVLYNGNTPLVVMTQGREVIYICNAQTPVKDIFAPGEKIMMSYYRQMNPKDVYSSLI